MDQFQIDVENSPLSTILDQLEIDLTKVGRGDLAQIRHMYIRLDTAFQKIQAMEAGHLAPKAEQAQLEYIAAMVEKNAGTVLRDWGGSAQLGQFRQQAHPVPLQRWWYVDEYVQARKQKTVRKTLFISAGAIVALLAFILIYNRFLAPDPIVTQKYSLQMSINDQYQAGEYEKALQSANQAVALDGQDASMLILRGMIYTRLGKSTEAETDFRAAEGIVNNRERFLLYRSQIWLQFGEPDLAIADAGAVVDLNPQSAEAVYYLGKANELKKNYRKAVDYYEKASAMAEAQGQAELNATIRVNMAMMMQSMPVEISTPTTAPAKP